MRISKFGGCRSRRASFRENGDLREVKFALVSRSLPIDLIGPGAVRFQVGSSEDLLLPVVGVAGDSAAVQFAPRKLTDG